MSVSVVVVVVVVVVCLLYYYYYDLIAQGSSKKKKKTLPSSSSQLEVYLYFLLCDSKAQSICSFDKQYIGNTMHSNCYPLFVAIAAVAIKRGRHSIASWRVTKMFVIIIPSSSVVAIL